MSHKAAVFTETGKNFEIRSIPSHTPQKGEVLIKSHAIATNPADGLIQKTGFFVQEYPAVLGFDVAGTVEAVGEGVTRFKKGDKVIGLASVPFTTRGGVFQEYTIIQEHYAGLMPDNVSFEEGSTLIAPTITTASSLFVDLAIPKPTSHKRPQISNDADVFYVNSAASAVGAAAVQLLAICGFRVIATSSPKNFDLVKSFGAAQVFDYNDSELVQKVKAAAGKKINLALDAASNDDSFHKSIEILEGTGNFIFVKPSALNLEKKNVNAMLANYSKIVDNKELGKWFWEFEKSAVEAGSFVGLRPEVIGTTIEDVQKVVDYHGTGKVSASKPVIKLI